MGNFILKEKTQSTQKILAKKPSIEHFTEAVPNEITESIISSKKIFFSQSMISTTLKSNFKKKQIQQEIFDCPPLSIIAELVFF